MTAEKLETLPFVTPEMLDDFWVARHFCNRPIFIRNFFGRIKLKLSHLASEHEILYSQGHSVRNEQKPGSFHHLPDNLLVRLSDHAFAQLTSRKITVYSETEAEAKELALPRFGGQVLGDCVS